MECEEVQHVFNLEINNKRWQAKRKFSLLEFYWIITVLLGRLKNQLEAQFPPEKPDTIPESLAEKSTSDLTTKAGSLAPCQVGCHGNFTHKQLPHVALFQSKAKRQPLIGRARSCAFVQAARKVGTEF